MLDLTIELNSLVNDIIAKIDPSHKYGVNEIELLLQTFRSEFLEICEKQQPENVQYIKDLYDGRLKTSYNKLGQSILTILSNYKEISSPLKKYRLKYGLYL